VITQYKHRKASISIAVGQPRGDVVPLCSGLVGVIRSFPSQDSDEPPGTAMLVNAVISTLLGLREGAPGRNRAAHSR
jgi:hypothetical protein